MKANAPLLANRSCRHLVCVCDVCDISNEVDEDSLRPEA